MKTTLYLVVITVLAFAEESAAVVDTQKTKVTNIVAAGKSTIDNTPSGVGGGLLGGMQQAVAGDLDLKMMMMEDGTPSGKCYCSCNLNNQPVFLEIDSASLPTYAFQ